MESNDIKYAILTENLNRVKCPFCGRTVHIEIGTSGTKDCPYCNMEFMLPVNDHEEISDEDFIDLECPSCGNTVSVDISIDEHEVVCPFCDAKLHY